MIKIYHKIKPTFIDEDKTGFPNGYEAVAVVNVNDLDEVYKLTQNLDNVWIENNAVFANLNASTLQESNGKKAFRSSSVGDVFELNSKFYVICMEGFEEIYV